MRLNAELVTLSACETGLAKSMNGDDVIGMTRGFLYVGSSNIVASLWEVDDAATTELMKQFYRNIKTRQSKKKSCAKRSCPCGQNFLILCFEQSFILLVKVNTA